MCGELVAADVDQVGRLRALPHAGVILVKRRGVDEPTRRKSKSCAGIWELVNRPELTVAS